MIYHLQRLAAAALVWYDYDPIKFPMPGAGLHEAVAIIKRIE
jgi:hypothetical protein